MRDVTKLFIWQRAVELAVQVNKAIPISAGRKSPGLRGQAVRAANAIAEAIAEGCGRNSEWELIRYVDIGMGSITELQTQLLLAYRYGMIAVGQFKSLWRECGELRRMMLAFQRKVRERATRNERDATEPLDIDSLPPRARSDAHPPRYPENPPLLDS